MLEAPSQILSKSALERTFDIPASFKTTGQAWQGASDQTSSNGPSDISFKILRTLICFLYFCAKTREEEARVIELSGLLATGAITGSSQCHLYFNKTKSKKNG